ncbi:MAG: hypothetical protein ACPGU5_08635 [Lishizhenia sp.]
MHHIEPHYNWRDFYVASEDELSPFYEREYSEFEFTDRLYNYVLHPQWDSIGSETLFLKIIYTDYEEGYTIIELIGEWNDVINNDIMILKRDIVEHLMANGIDKFILIGENVLNFHYSDDCYYEEWFDELDEGWIAFVNFQEHVLREFKEIHLDQYFVMGGKLEDMSWRTFNPSQFYAKISNYVQKRLA